MCANSISSWVHSDYFSELQALARKDAPTLASALVQVVKQICGPMLEELAAIATGCQGLEVVHILVGDSIGTNEAVYLKGSCTS